MAPFLAEFEELDLTGPIIVIAIGAAAALAACGRGLSKAARLPAESVVPTPWRSIVQAMLRSAGGAVMVAAAVVLIGGTWIGIRTKSAWQIERDAAAASCADEYPRFVAWERAGNSLDNWWTGDPLPRGAVPERSTRKQFIDRCVDMSR
jgi:hypothetical protein